MNSFYERAQNPEAGFWADNPDIDSSGKTAAEAGRAARAALDAECRRIEAAALASIMPGAGKSFENHQTQITARMGVVGVFAATLDVAEALSRAASRGLR